MKLSSKSQFFGVTIILVVITFVIGFNFELTAFDSCEKLLMPETYKVKLRSGEYIVWYYPNWRLKNQTMNSRFDPCPDYQDALTPENRPEVLIATDDDKKRISAKKLTKRRIPDSVGIGILKAFPVAEVNIEKTGNYLVFANSNSGKTFTLTLVPLANHTPPTMEEPGGFKDHGTPNFCEKTDGYMFKESLSQ